MLVDLNYLYLLEIKRLFVKMFILQSKLFINLNRYNEYK